MKRTHTFAAETSLSHKRHKGANAGDAEAGPHIVTDLVPAIAVHLPFSDILSLLGVSKDWRATLRTRLPMEAVRSMILNNEELDPTHVQPVVLRYWHTVMWTGSIWVIHEPWWRFVSFLAVLDRRLRLSHEEAALFIAATLPSLGPVFANIMCKEVLPHPHASTCPDVDTPTYKLGTRYPTARVRKAVLASGAILRDRMLALPAYLAKFDGLSSTLQDRIGRLAPFVYASARMCSDGACQPRPLFEQGGMEVEYFAQSRAMWKVTRVFQQAHVLYNNPLTVEARCTALTFLAAVARTDVVLTSDDVPLLRDVLTHFRTTDPPVRSELEDAALRTIVARMREDVQTLPHWCALLAAAIAKG
jgi:hypothetical protein